MADWRAGPLRLSPPLPAFAPTEGPDSDLSTQPMDLESHLPSGHP
jgi:hypothetical protein